MTLHHTTPKSLVLLISTLCADSTGCEYFLELNSLDILSLSETKIGRLDWFCSFSVRGYLPMIRKDPVTHMLIVGAYFEGELTFACDSFLENSYSYVFFLIDFSSLIALLGPRSLEGPIKSLLSVHLLSVCPSVRHFSQEWLFSFFLIFCMMVGMWNI